MDYDGFEIGFKECKLTAVTYFRTCKYWSIRSYMCTIVFFRNCINAMNYKIQEYCRTESIEKRDYKFSSSMLTLPEN